MKKALVAVLVFAGSLGMMSFTFQQMGICVKQTVTLDDGKVINAYYVQQGTGYAFYSSEDLTQYTEKDLYRIEDNHFSVSKGYEGKCYYKAESLQEVLDIANDMFKQYKPNK